MREHPVLAAVAVLMVVAGAVTGHLVLGEGFSATQRILGGALGGAGVALIVTASRWLA